MSELESLMELIARQQSDLLQHIQMLVRRDVERYEHDVLAAGVAQPVPDWARSVYVDNTQSAAAVTLTFDVGLRFLVPAGAGVVLPCAKFRSVVASQQVQVLWASARAPLAQVGGPGSAAVPVDVQVVGTAAVQLTGSLAPVPGPVILTVFNNIVIPAGGQTSLYSVSNTDSNGNRKWSKMYVNVIPSGSVNFALWWPTSTGGSQGTTIVSISAITSPLVEGPYDVSELPYIVVQLYNNSSTNATTGSSLLLALGA